MVHSLHDEVPGAERLRGALRVVCGFWLNTVHSLHDDSLHAEVRSDAA